MPRKPDERINQAKEMYLKGMKLVEIASQLNLPEGTIRSWKNRYGWDSNANATLQKPKRNVAKRKNAEKKAVAEAVDQVISNPDLTDKQRLFCVLYVKCFNATKAAIKAGYSKDSAMELGYQLLQKPSVRNEIARLKQNRLNREMLDESDIFQRYMDIAFGDITDYVEFGREKEQVMGAFGPVMVSDPETGEKIPLMREVNTIRFKESSEVDGSLISEIKQGKNGASVKLMDRLKALDWLADHMGMATPEQKARIEAMRARIGSGPEEEIEDDGFLEALKGTAAEDWKMSEVGSEEETDI